jgi:hypothetical protein
MAKRLLHTFLTYMFIECMRYVTLYKVTNNILLSLNILSTPVHPGTS